MRILVVVFYLVLSATALPHTSLKHRPGENPIDWRSVPPSVYEVSHTACQEEMAGWIVRELYILPENYDRFCLFGCHGQSSSLQDNAVTARFVELLEMRRC